MAHGNVPKFGNWENEDNVPYTVCFDKARQKRGGKMMKSNDPQEKTDVLPDNDPSPVAPAHSAKSSTRSEEPIVRGTVRPTPEHRVSKEDGEFRQVSSSSSQGESTGQRTANGGGRVQRPAPPARPGAGSEQSFERSPLHPHYQAKVVGRGSGSPAWEGKNDDSSHGTPGRSRLRPTTRGDESPDAGPTIPRFGEWDESDPQSAENFSRIFNKVREERNSGAGNISGTPKHPSYSAQGQRANEPKKCCFPWW